MPYQVFVQSRAGGVFSATVVGGPDCVAEGTTQEEALSKATAVLKAHLAKGRFFTVELEETPTLKATNPWVENHGSLRDDPTFDDFMAEIVQYRRQLEDEEAKP